MFCTVSLKNSADVSAVSARFSNYVCDIGEIKGATDSVPPNESSWRPIPCPSLPVVSNWISIHFSQVFVNCRTSTDEYVRIMTEINEKVAKSARLSKSKKGGFAVKVLHCDLFRCWYVYFGSWLFHSQVYWLAWGQNPPCPKNQIPQFRRGSESASARHLNLLVTMALEPAKLVRAYQRRYHSTGNCRTGRAPFLDKIDFEKSP